MNRHSRRRWGDHNARNRGKNYPIMGEQRWINKKRGSQLLIRLIAAAERKDNLGIHSINNLCMRLVLKGGWFTLYLMDDFTMETFIHLDLIKHCFIGRSFEWTLLLPLLLLFRLRSSTYAASRNPYRQVVLNDWMAAVEPCSTSIHQKRSRSVYQIQRDAGGRVGCELMAPCRVILGGVF